MTLKIKELREELQMTQRELAEKLNNMQRNVSNWENGTSEPDCATLIRLADIFQVSLDELFGREHIPSPSEEDEDRKLYRTIRGLSAQKKQALAQFLSAFPE